MLLETITRPRVNPILCVLTSQNPMSRGHVYFAAWGRKAIKPLARSNLSVCNPFSAVDWRGRLTRTQYTQDVTRSNTVDTGVLEFCCNETSDEKANDLQRSTGAIQQGGVERREAQTLDDRATEVRKDTIGY